MRRFFLALMIVLLPLRGWMGDAMAVEMSTAMVMQNMTQNSGQNSGQKTAQTTAKNVDATITVANYLYTTWANGQFDAHKVMSGSPECPGHAAMASGHLATTSGTAANGGDVASHVVGEIGTGIDGNVDIKEAASGHCNTCGACQICHSVALTSTVTLSAPDFIPHALPSTGSIRFASAVAALCQKPPIS